MKPGTYYDAVGEKAGVYGTEAGPLEAWIYPVKVLSDFRLSFRPAGASRDIPQQDVAERIVVRPESVTLVYAHPRFSVKQIVLAPHDRAGALVLLDVESREPLHITAGFLPQMRPMWPAPFTHPETSWNAERNWLQMRGGEFRAVLAAPGWSRLPPDGGAAEPRETLEIPASPTWTESHFLALAVAASGEAVEALLRDAPQLFAAEAAYYRDFLASTVSIETPEPRLDEAFLWARLAIRKGLVETPGVGRGLVAGYSTSGTGERPGFAWYFGRDSMWTALALDAYGDFAAARAAMDFLRRYQRTDGKIPHEVTQSANLVPWFKDFPYPWASADSTPLYIIAHADYWRATGDTAYIRRAWASLVMAYRYMLSTDADSNGLVENTAAGHGWVEGGRLFPAHEEIYLQGLWVEALRSMAAMAQAADEPGLAAECRKRAEDVRAHIEKTYWLEESGGYYAFATQQGGGLTREITVLPAVPMWWRVLEEGRGRRMLEQLAAAGIHTDWGTRILTRASPKYDGTSYHYGSVWPLFTGWAAMAAFRYGRADLGYTLLMENAHLTFSGALGAVTELLSGDYFVPVGRSSHHQLWSSAMVAAPALRGLLGVEVDLPSRTLRLEPHLPPAWNGAKVRNVPFGEARPDIEYAQTATRLTATVRGEKLSGHVVLNGREAALASPATTVSVDLPSAPQAWVEFAPPEASESSRGLRLVRSEAAGDTLSVTLEGRAGGAYRFLVFSPRKVVDAGPAHVVELQEVRAVLEVEFPGSGGDFVRQVVTVRFAPAAPARRRR